MIERTTHTTPAPLTVLRREDLDASGRSTLGDILQQLPAQANAIDPRANNGGDGWARVDLRGLGSSRTLTLLNGRRLVAGGTGAGASVDVNSIPLAVIDRVEILKAGGSAIYGSDAIGGVVNIITRNDFEGTEASLYAAASQHDGFMYDASVITGHRSENKKGNILLSAGIQAQDPVFAGNRLFSNYDVNFGFDVNRVDFGRTISPSRGRIDASNIDIDGDGHSDSVNLCGAGYCASGGDGSYHPFSRSDLSSFQPSGYLHTMSPRYNVYGSGRYEPRPGIAGFFEASYVYRTSDHQFAREPFSTLVTGIGISKNSLYNPIGGDVNGYDRDLVDLGPLRSRQRIGTFRAVVGLQGAIPEDAPALRHWKWEVSYDYGRNDGANEHTGDLSVSRLANALGPSFVNANGVAICGTPTAPIDGCVPMNILGPPGSIDPAARDYVTLTGTSRGSNEQQTVLATTHGQIAKLSHHGDVSLAVGTDFRKEAAEFTPIADTIGNVRVPARESYHVFEGFGELSVVPMRDEKLAERVELDLAARGFHYDLSGSGVTWNAGGLFRPFKSFAVRGMYATAFHAPSIGESFLGNLVKDQRSLAGVTLPNHEAETARIITTGVVFEPPQVEGLSVTADYWNIDVTKQIQPLSPSPVDVTNCYNAGIQAFCDQLRNRFRDNPLQLGISPIDSIYNQGSTSTSGLDISVAFDRQFGELGRIHEQLESQVLFEYNVDFFGHSTQPTPNRGDYDFGVEPTIKASLSSTWQHPSGVSAGLNLRYVGCTQCNLPPNPGTLSSFEDAPWYKVDLFGSYTLKSSAGSTTLAVGVNNLLDRKPSLLYIGTDAEGALAPYRDSLAAASSDASTFDYVGRFVYARLSHRF